MPIIQFDADGNITAIVSQPTNRVGLEVDSDFMAVSPASHYVRDGALVAYTAEQAASKANTAKRGPARWDNDAMAWFDLRTADQARIDRLRDLQRQRDGVITGGFSWDGSTFDSDDTSQIRLIGLAQAARDADFEPVNWRLADNSWRTLSAADALGVWSALKDHIRNTFAVFAALEADLVVASTLAEIDLIRWP